MTFRQHVAHARALNRLRQAQQPQLVRNRALTFAHATSQFILGPIELFEQACDSRRLLPPRSNLPVASFRSWPATLLSSSVSSRTIAGIVFHPAAWLARQRRSPVTNSNRRPPDARRSAATNRFPPKMRPILPTRRHRYGPAVGTVTRQSRQRRYLEYVVGRRRRLSFFALSSLSIPAARLLSNPPRRNGVSPPP